jgi:3-deoxy-7-phosphoheptulonate synthase
VESLELTVELAEAVRDAGGNALRGGAFKPRTSPYSFQGLGREGLEILAEARARTGLPIVTEVLDTRLVGEVAELADAIQIGSRSMHNQTLLREVGGTGRPVLLKRGMAATLQEFLLAAETLLDAGTDQVVLCERGLRSFDRAVRNVLDISAVPALKARTHLPVVVDPSHAAGRADLVEPLAHAAAAVGADGLLIEIHSHPAEARSDGDQAIAPERLAPLVERCRAIAELVHRTED